MPQKIKKQVITVAVITYNSSSTIIETLESIRLQTYGAEYIELIISDDCSSDNTVACINDWLEIYGTKFYSVKLIISDDNMGISANINQAWKAASSCWIKSIAGDDLLLKNCLVDNCDYVQKNHDIKVLFSYMKTFGKTNDQLYPESQKLKFFEKSAQEQYLDLVKYGGFAIAPTSFIERSTLADFNYADERFNMIEDYPLWLKLTLSGIKLHFFDKETVLYRIGDSASRTSKVLVNIRQIALMSQIDEAIVFPHLNYRWSIFVLRKKIVYLMLSILVKATGNNISLHGVFLRKMINAILPRSLRK